MRDLSVKHSIGKRITIAFWAIVMLFYIVSCSPSKTPITERVTDRSLTPQLSAYAITTIVSDSGVIRYRISSNEWQVFAQAVEPYWDFPQGLHFERFDNNYNVDAQLTCKRDL